MDMHKQNIALDEAEKFARLRLIRSENIGPITFYRLLDQFSSARVALEHLPDLARKGGRKKALKISSVSDTETEILALQEIGAHMVFWGTAEYPPLLAHINDAPPILFVRGHLHLMAKKAVAVVGSRNASINGRRFAQSIAQALGESGYLVVSGMARGIDTSAHLGALPSGTVAALGCGVDVVYPRENTGLYNNLIETGAVCSEVTIGTTPQARHFPRRNRIISGMSRAIVVLEACAKSGSLITARMALEQNREVFAVPGPPQDPRVKGSNALIRDGAYLNETANDILQVLSDMSPNAFSEGRRRAVSTQPMLSLDDKELDLARDRIHQALDYGPTDVDDFIRDTGQSPAAVAAILLELEVAGKLERQNGNKVALISSS